MCGIAGIMDVSGRLTPAELSGLCMQVRDGMVHRGPDDCGVWSDPCGGIALGHRRLSIIDVSAAGRQPMITEDGAGVLTFNGEIYNFQTLRGELEALGERFVSHSDSEVLLKGLHRFGVDFIARLDGMYAFAYWDRTRRKLILARDRFGEKPLYLYRSGACIAFASELAALTVLPEFDDRIPIDNLASYLCFQYVPAPQSIYAAIRKVMPGCVLEITDGGVETVSAQMPFTPSSLYASDRRIEDLADQLEEKLVRTLRTRLISDVPLGAFLSGGVDSSTVAALAAKRLNLSLNTCSIGFAGSDDSEHLEAREIAQYLGLDHVDRIVDPDVCAMAEMIGAVLDEPNGDSSCLPTYLLSELARERCTVALSGDGGDELFGGYGRYFATLHDHGRWLAGELPYPQWRPDLAYYSSRMLLFPETELRVLFDVVPAGLTLKLDALRSEMLHASMPLGAAMRRADARDYMPGAVLAKVDRMSMRHSLEVRATLLGKEVAEFAQGLAEDECFNETSGKLVLKAVATRYLPKEWLARPKKGFGLPMRGWSEQNLLTATRKLLSPHENRLASWLGQARLDAFLDEQTKAPMTYRLWAVLILEHWLRTHPGRPG